MSSNNICLFHRQSRSGGHIQTRVSRTIYTGFMRSRILRAGLPPTTVHGAMSLNTLERAPTTAPSPTWSFSAPFKISSSSTTLTVVNAPPLQPPNRLKSSKGWKPASLRLPTIGTLTSRPELWIQSKLIVRRQFAARLSPEWSLITRRGCRVYSLWSTVYRLFAHTRESASRRRRDGC